MNRHKRVYVSVPRDHNLTGPQVVLKHAILATLRRNGIEPQEFHVSGLPLRLPYTSAGVRDVMARCHGALILAFARWQDPSGDAAIPTVWNHFEGAFALALRKEILVLTEDHVSDDGITWSGGEHIIVRVPRDAGPASLESESARLQIQAWIDAIQQTHDVFLAYSTKARATALDVGRFLRSEGVAVRDWEIDFAAGPTILEELLEATRNCLGAVMLLTKDDELVAPQGLAAPRDNVIFETGLFMSVKGRERVLLIVEDGVKLPSDIAGGIHVPLKDRSDIRPIETRLRDFMSKRI
jgi:hypothetical protein